jgi:hypothetical protein
MLTASGFDLGGNVLAAGVSGVASLLDVINAFLEFGLKLGGWDNWSRLCLEPPQAILNHVIGRSVGADGDLGLNELFKSCCEGNAHGFFHGMNGTSIGCSSPILANSSTPAIHAIDPGRPRPDRIHQPKPLPQELLPQFVCLH